MSKKAIKKAVAQVETWGYIGGVALFNGEDMK
mgnify:CR=1 FL=1